MKINKLSQKILASVLMLAVLICGMFCLTACGEDEDKNAELNNRITELQNQLNNANKQNQEQQQDLENQLFLAKIKNTLSVMVTQLSQPLTIPATPVERAVSSIGIAYEGNYSHDNHSIETDYNSYVRNGANFKGDVEVILEIMNSNQFKEGELYQDSKSTETEKIQFMIKIDKEKKAVTILSRMLDLETNQRAYLECEIQLNDSYTDWISCTCRVDNPVGVFEKSLSIIEKGTSATLPVKSLNKFEVIDGDVIKNVHSCDFDTNYHLRIDEVHEVPTTISQALMTKYGNELNGIDTRVNNVFNGKTVYGEVSTW